MRKPWYHFLYVRSPILKILLGIIGVLGSVAFLLFQFYMEEPRMAAQAANWEGRSIEKGADLFANNCANCHLQDGKGIPNVAPALNSKYFFSQRLVDIGWSGSVKDYIELTLLAGRPSKINTQWQQMMPTWSNRVGGPMQDDQILHLVNFVANWEATALQQSAEEDPFQCFVGVPTKAREGEESPDALQIKICGENGESALPGEPLPEIVEAEAPSGEPRDPAVIFATLGCAGCHNLTLDQTPSTLGQPGPNVQNLPETAGERVAGQDAQTYVHNSIVNPNEYINDGYIAGIMPQNFADQLSEEEISALVDWLLDPNRPQ